MVRFNLIIISILVAFATDLVAQCKSWENHPDGVQKAKEQHMYYRDLFNSEKYTEAFPIWEKLFVYVQTPKDVPKRHFKDGIKMYQERIKTSQDPQHQKEDLQKMINLYEQLAICTGERSIDRAYQAYYMHRFQANTKTVLEVAQKALDLGKTETHEMVFMPYATTLIEAHQEGILTKEQLIAGYNQLKKIVDHHQKTNSKKLNHYQNKWLKVQELFDIADQKLDIFDCAYYVAKYSLDYTKFHNKLEQLKSIQSLLNTKCDPYHPFYQQLVDRVNALEDSLLQAKEDSCLSYCPPYEQAKLLTRRGKMAEAIKAYTKALEQVDLADSTKGDIAYKIAYFYYVEKADFSTARSYALQAAQFKPKWGNPYILIGLLYAATGKKCGTDDWDIRTVYWAALDAWEKAKVIDPLTQEQAQEYIQKYSQHLPTIGQGHTKGIKNGDDYTIKCWINAKTKVRLRQSH